MAVLRVINFRVVLQIRAIVTKPSVPLPSRSMHSTFCLPLSNDNAEEIFQASLTLPSALSTDLISLTAFSGFLLLLGKTESEIISCINSQALHIFRVKAERLDNALPIEIGECFRKCFVR